MMSVCQSRLHVCRFLLLKRSVRTLCLALIDPTMMPCGAAGLMCCPPHLAYYSWPTLQYFKCSLSEPPGLELLQCPEHLALPEANCATRLDNDALATIRKLKRSRIDELIGVCLRVQDGEVDLSEVARYLMAPTCGHRNKLMDIIVLTLAESERCQSRADFDADLEGIVGASLDAVWRSRFHGSVYHTLRVNGVPCFKRKNKSRQSPKAKTRSVAIGPVYLETLSWLGGPER